MERSRPSCPRARTRGLHPRRAARRPSPDPRGDPPARGGRTADLRRPGARLHGRLLRDARAGSGRRRSHGLGAPARVRGRPSSLSSPRETPARDRGARADGSLDPVAGRLGGPADPRPPRGGRGAVAGRRGTGRRGRVRTTWLGPASGNDPHLCNRRERVGRGALVDARIGLGGLPWGNPAEQHARRARRDRLAREDAGRPSREHDDADARARVGTAAARARERGLGAAGRGDRAGDLAVPPRDARSSGHPRAGVGIVVA
jgi:hypothetical protein